MRLHHGDGDFVSSENLGPESFITGAMSVDQLVCILNIEFNKIDRYHFSPSCSLPKAPS